MPWHFCAVGRGRPAAEWAALLGALAETGYDGPISIEHEDPDLDPEAGIEASIAGLIGAHDLSPAPPRSAPTTSTPRPRATPRRTRTPPAKFNKPRTPSQGAHDR